MSLDIQINNPSGQFALQNHDIVLDGIGSTIILTGQDKLIQDVQKILFTPRNYFDVNYSTQWDDIIGSNLGVEQTENIIAQRVTDALVYLQYLQQQQAKYQQVQSSEIIQQIQTINVNYLYELTNNDNDLRTFTVGIVLITQGNQVVNVTGNITIV